MLKQIFEKITGAKILRNAMPRGAFMENDVNNLSKGPLHEVWDIGAHQGETSLKFRKYFPKALLRSFEPIRDNFEKLEYNCRHTKRQDSYQIAFGEKSANLKINLRANSVLNSLKKNLNRPKPDDLGVETIEVVTIDEFIRSKDIQVVDLIKMDVEGFEHEVLQGAHESLISGKVNFIYLETGLDDRFVSFESLIERLQKYSILPYGIYEQSPHWTGIQKLWYWNALFVKEELL